MTHFEWNKEFELEIGFVDEQHREIVRYINEIADIDEQKKAGAHPSLNTLLESFDGLIAISTSHFAEEEALMDKYEFEGRETHKIIHKNLISKLVKLREQAVFDGFTMMENLLGFLNIWLKSHILGIDKKYADHIHTKISKAA